MGEPFIKLYKKMLDWEWYDDPNTKILFLHCLLRANWKPTKWHGIQLEPGQFITSLPNLAEETHLSIKQVRVALKHLVSTGDVADKGQTKYRIITVNNWNKYQVEGRQRADKGQDEGRQRASDKEYKNIRIEEYNTHIGESAPIVLGIYHNVRLTQEELQELMRQYPDDYKDMIDNLSTYMRSKGKLYDDHFATMMRWKHEDQEKAKQKPETKRRNLIEEIRNA